MIKRTHIIPVFAFLLTLSITACKSKKSDDPEPTPTDQDANVQVKNIQKRSFKRGVSYGFQLMDDVALLAPGSSWFYNWANDISATLDNATTASKMEFFPMTWNNSFDPDKIRAYKAKHPECQYILAYNEPNLTDQANMTPKQAAAVFYRVKNLADELKMKIISPAMNYGTLAGYSDPIKWLDEFFQEVPLSYFDGIAIHCYMASPSAFRSYVKMFKKYGKPIWMTEFCAWENSIKSPSAQMRYMVDVINYMEKDPDVYRYAWFIPRNSGPIDTYPFMQLLTKTQPYKLTDLGVVFNNLSSFDNTTYYGKGVNIPIAQYVANNSMANGVDNWASSAYLRPTTDKSGILEAYDFFANNWLEYQIDVPETGTYQFKIRYAAYVKSAVELSANSSVIKTIDLPSTGEENIWKTSTTSISLTKGKQTIRIKSTTGSPILNWLSFN